MGLLARPYLNVIIVSSIIVIIFPFTILTRSSYQRQQLHRRIRSVIYGQEQRSVANYLPSLVNTESEWRFVSEQVSNDIGDCSYFPPKYDENSVVGQGYSKRVYKYGRTAIKRLMRDGQALKECSQRGKNESRCWEEQVDGFVNEVGLLLLLRNDTNVPKIFAYCLPTDPREDLVLAMELARPLNSIDLIQMGWNERLELVVDVLGLLKRIRPLQPLDLRRQQFVLRDSTPLLTDFDNVVKSEVVNETEVAKRFHRAFVGGVLRSNDPKVKSVLNRLKRSFNDNSIDLQVLQEHLQQLQSFDLH